jgi:hypothetical protein
VVSIPRLYALLNCCCGYHGREHWWVLAAQGFSWRTNGRYCSGHSYVAYLQLFTTPVLSLSSALFFRTHQNLAAREKKTTSAQPTMIQPRPSWYLGSWLVRKKYGVNQCDTLETQLAIAMRDARLVLGLGTTVVSHETWMLRPTNGPEQRRMSKKYRAPTLSVEIMITAPTSVAKMGTIICQQCSSMRPEDQDTRSVTMYAMR